MKYSLIELQPRSNASWAQRSISSSLTPLLIVSRSRWLPASGAKVNPPRFPVGAIASTSSTVKASTRVLGSDRSVWGRRRRNSVATSRTWV